MNKLRLYSGLAGLAGVMLTLAFLFVVAVIYATTYDDEPPLVFSDGSGVAYVADDGDTVFFYRRTSTANRGGQVDIARTLMCRYKSEVYALDLPGVYREYKANDVRDIVRVIHYPDRLPLGTECELDTILKWSPRWSMSWHTAQMPLIRFVVTERPES